MLVQPTLEQLLPKVESRYTLAMLVAKRTRQLVDGAQPMVDSDSPNLVTLACEEVFQDKVVCMEGIFTPVVPLRPEIEEARRIARELAANQASLDSFPDLMDLPKGAAADEDLVDKVLVDDVILDEELADEVIDLIEDLSEDAEEIVIADDILGEDSSESSETEE
ncbi:MAG: DNA-directed RNA polymerase subunit omega [Eubacteriales bacterium]